MNEKVGVVYQQLLKTANRNQQNTDNIHLLVENCDINLEILNKLAHLNQLEIHITVMSELFFSECFSFVHVLITAITTFFKLQLSFMPINPGPLWFHA